ncbi:MAG TPA: DinB family protein [Bryobacteraceae bacterium]|jgi:uncharacterized damage-inducible protein DinB|nr:DinB family protein [Bryobacteraceae bacterium]
MQIRELLLPEYDREMEKTRATLARVPENDGEFKPHEKSTMLKKLSGHLAQLPLFGEMILTTPEFDMAVNRMQPLIMESQKQLLQAFDGQVKETREKLAAASDEALFAPWKLSAGERVIMKGTRYEMLRGLMLNHIVHHRAQLGVYLRMKDVPVPSIYGPSADEAN